MQDQRTNMWITLAVTIAFASALVMMNCWGARPPNAVGNTGGTRHAKTAEDFKLEQETIKSDIENKPDLVAEETYIENDGTELGLKIVVQSNLEDEENKDIYLLDETGMNPIRLTNYESVESFPCITDDGKTVFFVSNLEGQEQINPFQIYTEIYKLDIETKELTRLTFDDRMDYAMTVSGDGSKIVYLTQEMGQEGFENPQMLVMDGDGKNQRVFEDEALKNCLPKLSGDGNWLVFNSLRHGSYDIFLKDMRKLDEEAINLTNSFVSEYFPTINYNGTVIVYEKLLNGVQDESLYELYRIDPDGGNETAITNDKFCDSFPVLTNDGKHIVFVSKRWDWDEDGHPNEALFIMNIDGTNMRKISKDAAYFDQPDL